MAIVPDRARLGKPVDYHVFSKLELAGGGKMVNITASNTINNPIPVKALVAETAGDIAMVNPDGSVVVVTVVPGQTIPGGLIRINSTGTTATFSGVV